MHDIAVGISAGGDRSLFETKGGSGIRGGGLFDTDSPTLTGERFAGGRKVPSEVYKDRAAEGFRYELKRSINGIFFAKATEVDLHSIGDLENFAIPANLFPADGGKKSFDGIARWWSALSGKIPKRSQDAGCDIKITIAELVSGVCEVEEAGGFFVHFNRSMLVNLVDDIVVPIAALFDLNPLCFLKDDLADRPRFWFALGLNEDFAGSSHSAEANNVFRSFPPVPKVK